MQKKQFTVSMVALSTFLFSACDQPGGPCEYTTLITEGRVVALKDEKVYTDIVGSDVVALDEVRFPETPKKGHVYRIRVDQIIKGSCSPYAYKIIERISQ